MLVATLVVLCGACRSPTPPGTPAPASQTNTSKRAEPVETRFSGLALGETHSCALHQSGQVYCWGDNRSGQVGNGSPADLVSVPSRVLGVEHAVQIVAVDDQSCARTALGEVWCWGQGLGHTAQAVEGLEKPANDLVVCDGAFGSYGCAQQGGEVSCWGSLYVNDVDGTPLLPSDKAVVIPNLHDASDLACHNNIVCARRGERDALCWGNTEEDGMMAASAVTEPEPLPAFPATLSPVSSFGAISSCHDGACWSLAPPKDSKVFPLNDIQSIASSADLGCTLRTSGQVKCVGRMKSEVDEAGMLRGVRASLLAVGESHACVLDQERGVLCWGDNDRAQLGDGSWGQAVPAPQELVGLAGVNDLKLSRRWGDLPDSGVMLVELSGTGDALAVEHLTNWQWRGIAVDSKQELLWWGGTRQPLASKLSPRMTYADLNAEELCASTKEGLLCAPLTRGELEWKRVSSHHFDQLSAGGHHFCARDVEGHAWCWGSNMKGALGDGGNADRKTPLRVAGLESIEQIASGDAHSCARSSEGRIFCWGKNTQGRLGDGTTVSRQKPVAVLGLDDAIDLSIGKDTSCAVRSSGRVSCWGRRFTGLALGLLDVAVEPAMAVSVGCDHACSLSSTGAVQCWGDNEFGQLGAVPGTLKENPDGASTSALWSKSYLGPATVAGLPPAKRVVAGCNSSCAETLDGSVFCWGSRASIGEGQQSLRTQARPVAGPQGGWPGLVPVVANP